MPETNTAFDDFIDLVWAMRVTQKDFFKAQLAESKRRLLKRARQLEAKVDEKLRELMGVHGD